MSGITTAIAATIDSVVAAGPSLLYDSFNATGEGAWTFDGSDTAEYYGGQRSMVIASTTTINRIDVKLTGRFWTTYSTYKIYLCTIDGSHNIDIGSPIGASDPVSGSAAWNSTVVQFNFSTPAVISPQTIGFAIGPASRLPSFAGSGTTTDILYTTGASLTGQMVFFSNTGVVKYDTTFPAYDLQMQIYGS